MGIEDMVVTLTADAAGLHRELQKAQKSVTELAGRVNNGLQDIGREIMAKERNVALAGIGAALDALSWDWLIDTHPVLAEAVEEAVDDGVEARDIRRYVMAQTQRLELALRCEQAARYLEPAVE